MRETATLLYTSPPPVYKAGRAAPQWFVELVTPRTQQVELRVKGGAHRDHPGSFALHSGYAWDDMKYLIWLALGFLVLVQWCRVLVARPRVTAGGNDFCAACRQWSAVSSTRVCLASHCPSSDAIGQTFQIAWPGALEGKPR
jgi:hypothetical protein